MVTLSAIFGDDEHTASEAPYVRVLRARKWVLLTSALLLFAVEGHFVSAGLTELLPFLSLSDRDVAWAAGLGLLYSLTIYVCLLGQLMMSYGRVLKERMWARLDAEVDKIESQIRSAEMNIARLETMKRMRPETDDGLMAETEIARARDEIQRLNSRKSEMKTEQPSKAFVFLETSIDLTRVLPVHIIAFYALARWWAA